MLRGLLIIALVASADFPRSPAVASLSRPAGPAADAARRHGGCRRTTRHVVGVDGPWLASPASSRSRCLPAGANSAQRERGATEAAAKENAALGWAAAGSASDSRKAPARQAPRGGAAGPFAGAVKLSGPRRRKSWLLRRRILHRPKAKSPVAPLSSLCGTGHPSTAPSAVGLRAEHVVRERLQVEQPAGLRPVRLRRLVRRACVTVRASVGKRLCGANSAAAPGMPLRRAGRVARQPVVIRHARTEVKVGLPVRRRLQRGRACWGRPIARPRVRPTRGKAHQVAVGGYQGPVGHERRIGGVGRFLPTPEKRDEANAWPYSRAARSAELLSNCVVELAIWNATQHHPLTTLAFRCLRRGLCPEVTTFTPATVLSIAGAAHWVRLVYQNRRVIF